MPQRPDRWPTTHWLDGELSSFVTRHFRRITALCSALALPALALAQHGAPFTILKDQHVGPYVVTVWAAPDVGMGMVYVVYEPAKGMALVRPSRVRVGVAPLSGRLPEVLHDASLEPGGRGARFVAHVAFDRSEEWRVRVITEGPAGISELTSRVRATAPGGLGRLGLAIYTLPFIAVALLYWRATTVTRRRASGQKAALASP